MSASLISNYPQLQNLIKRDRSCYRDEFLQQLTYFQNIFEIVRLAPQDPSDSFCELLQFICHVSHCYPAECKSLPLSLIQILDEFSTILHPTLRICIVKCLFVLKNKSLISVLDVVTKVIFLFKCQDKLLREMLYDLVFNEIKNANRKSKNVQLNRGLQGLFYSIVEGKGDYENAGGLVVRYSLRLLVDLFRKNIWNDERTANLIAKCCFLKDAKSSVISLKFFVLSSQSDSKSLDSDDSEDSDSAEQTYKNLLKASHISGNTKAKKQQVKRALDRVKRKENRKFSSSSSSSIPSFYAIEMINDPEGFAEKLFSLLKTTSARFKIKLLMINVLTSVIAVHRLQLLDIYQYVTRYLSPQQRDVTLLLAYAAQSCHEEIPPHEVEILIRAIANNFVSDHCANEVIVVGLNSIREIVKRCPLAMNDVLMQDLAQYKSYRDKGVMMAARSLIGFYREVNPIILHKKDCGKEGNIGVKQNASFNSKKISTGIEGIECLMKSEEKSEENINEEESTDEFEEESDVEEMESDADMVSFDEEESDAEEESFDEEESDVEEDSLEGAESSTENVELIEKNNIEASINSLPIPRPLEMTRLLTDEEFRKISKMQRKKILLSSFPSSKNASLSSSESSGESDEEPDVLGLVPQSSIAYQPKKKRASYEDRIARMEEGRKERDKFGSKRGKESRGSKTNKEKSKDKNFMMMIHKQSVKLKKKRSAKQKQRGLIAHLKRQKMKK